MTASLNPMRAVLSNGLVVTAKQTRKTPAVAINLALRAGAIVDPGDAAGASVLLSRVLDRGTTGKSSTEIADALENRGVSLSLSVTRQLLSDMHLPQRRLRRHLRAARRHRQAPRGAGDRPRDAQGAGADEPATGRRQSRCAQRGCVDGCALRRHAPVRPADHRHRRIGRAAGSSRCQ